ILPSLVAGAELGQEMLEVGPGPGAATAWLRHRVARLVVLEVDAEAAGKLADTYAGTNVEVVTGDATEMVFGDASFDSAGSFTMLHHVPTAAQQNQLLAEVWRVLRPGGVLIGSDSVPSDGLHQFHAGDTYNPIEPSGLLVRLQTLGFDRITVTVADRLGFVAYKPGTMAPAA
ncbi:MAG: class I SAM-dependent methyltransferase, partial [Acidimicrobiales bacterium]